MEPNEIEQSVPIVYIEGERVDPPRLGRPPRIQQPSPSFHDQMRKRMGTDLTDELFEALWSAYQQFRQLGGDFFIFRCSGKHEQACTGISEIAACFWPPECLEYTAKQLNLEASFGSHPAYTTKRKLAFWNTEAGKVERKKEFAAAVEWLREHDCGDHEQWLTRMHLLHFVGLAGIVGVPKVFDAETEADLEAALAAK